MFLTLLRIEAAASLSVVSGPDSIAALDRVNFAAAYDRSIRPVKTRVEEQVKLAEVMLISHFKPPYNEHHLKDFVTQTNSVTENLRLDAYTNALCLMNSPAGLRFGSEGTSYRRCHVIASEVPSKSSMRTIVGAAAESLMGAIAGELNLSVDLLEHGPWAMMHLWNAIAPPQSPAVSRMLADGGIQHAVFRRLSQ
ncbi:hypothetical protein [Actinopolymorpha pittospori]|uniref:Uncharacterized protein n=1 Tax=Actinopolymorpha pittospori TaxID=648752 RepID=A0A927MRJ0_9ACTN|nr:hypothetical protein [Actinopolymorpha pittospori]MBE1605570.1 hypothetical protein [Actinopolymorpha pittospori]